jgi:hypothetical protein
MSSSDLSRSWRTRRPSRWAIPVAVLAMVAFSGMVRRSALAQTTFGTLSNFDVFNDTGQECHGFEIELDGISSADISFTFGSPYQRYGNPEVTELAGNTYVRYLSPYDSSNQTYTQTTPLAPNVITPTDGHACWTGGSANYLTSGCEHFGVGFNRNPTSTVYRWLVADPAHPGALQPSGTKVSIPAPIWNVSPPPQGGVNPIVQAVLPAEPPEVNQQYGDAHWVKVFVTESADPVELHHLVTDDPAVPQDAAETEVEWVLLQAGPNANNELANGGEIGAGKQSVTRRYEFYEYTGAYDPESHEALPVNESNPDAGDLGNYIGAQMAAVNLVELASTPTPTPTPTPTRTPTPMTGRCVGDCDGGGAVTIEELITLVNMALGNQPQLSACPSGIPADVTDVLQVDIALIIRAVSNALNGCPAMPTPTPTL